ncbi:calcineurin-like phosphoesterase C-terminal domain-containing protein [Citricoccus sp. I39-566]|uniref:calcineurin-like phosphoesterase C-terminal domain-containing protein n=1 Tax=Citricoccus sp. I39-566 TaxID=3073268 RepID=UPI00286BA814|nr:calcineurin-like phosphoesterase C-terminal domain-containing protein [Citricoccus sp. I39-566]WMY78028.1 calcineurin-like phosphoesterase C-terminal domain-containing protein [Citricoccus sp. I39-566]
MNAFTRPTRPRKARLAAGALALATTGALLSPAVTAAAATPVTAPTTAATPAADAGAAWDETAFRGSVDVVDGADETPEVLEGVVFDDLNQNSQQDEDEPGIADVSVSNGRDIVTTDEDGAYELPAFENMTAFVTQPAGYQVPVDEENVAQFHYHHLPEGSPELKYGGLEPTGALPAAVNFPLAQDEDAAAATQECLVGGDVQTYTEEEIEYARAGAFADLAARSGYENCGALFVGDVAGDDLSLYPGIRTLTEMINGPARFLPGNHDIDFDATEQEHAFDSYRAGLGPEYYSYDVGDAHFVALNNVEYPFSGDTTYNGAIDEEQMEWLRQDIANTPEDKLVVIAAHIPLLGFADQNGTQHQTDQVKEIHELLEGREAISLAGHVHAIENLREGDSLASWKELFDVDELPFPHLTVGAISGDWYSGEMLDDGYPTALQRDGAYPGVLTMDLEGNQVSERFTRTGDDGTDQMALGLNTPAYRDWFEENIDAEDAAPEFEDPLTVGQDELADTWLTTNFFMGATGSTVEVSVDGGEAQAAERTQPMQGEEQYTGAEYSDPTAVQEQLVHGGSVADRTSHLWRLPVPEDLEAGEHTAEVTATDVHGNVSTESLTFEVTEGSTEPEGPITFSDNPEGSAFYAPVQWMAANNISTGYVDGTFRKYRDVTRGQTAAFLHRFVKPEFEAPEDSPFDDVTDANSFYEPITWAAAEEITLGYADGTFQPYQSVTRGEFATFLYRLAGPEHTAPGESPFDDLTTGNIHYEAITWLASQGITIGDTEGHFNASEAVTRGEISAFLQRYDNTQG